MFQRTLAQILVQGRSQDLKVLLDILERTYSWVPRIFRSEENYINFCCNKYPLMRIYIEGFNAKNRETLTWGKRCSTSFLEWKHNSIKIFLIISSYNNFMEKLDLLPYTLRFSMAWLVAQVCNMHVRIFKRWHSYTHRSDTKVSEAKKKHQSFCD